MSIYSKHTSYLTRHTDLLIQHEDGLLKGSHTASCSVGEEKYHPAITCNFFFLLLYCTLPFPVRGLEGETGKYSVCILALLKLVLNCSCPGPAPAYKMERPKSKSGKQLPKTTEINNTFSLTPSLSPHTQTPTGGHSYS